MECVFSDAVRRIDNLAPSAAGSQNAALEPGSSSPPLDPGSTGLTDSFRRMIEELIASARPGLLTAMSVGQALFAISEPSIAS